MDCVFVSLSINTQLFDYELPASYFPNTVAGGSLDCREGHRTADDGVAVVSQCLMMELKPSV